MAKKKKQSNSIDKSQANQTLQNVFEACNQTPNVMGVDQLIEQKKALVHPYNVWIIVSLIALILTFLSPLALNPMSNRVNPTVAKTADIVISNHYVENNHFVMNLKGDFIDYSSIYAINGSGKKVYPDSYSANDGVVYIPYKETEEFNIYISDYNGKQLHLVLSPKE